MIEYTSPPKRYYNTKEGGVNTPPIATVAEQSLVLVL